MTVKLPKLIATSVVRGSQQGESHGGVFTVDFEKQEGEQRVDWNTEEIDFDGFGLLNPTENRPFPVFIKSPINTSGLVDVISPSNA